MQKGFRDFIAKGNPLQLAVAFAMGAAFARMQKPAEEGPPTTKECSYCRSTIPIAASRCAHCTSELGVA